MSKLKITILFVAKQLSSVPIFGTDKWCQCDECQWDFFWTTLKAAKWFDVKKVHCQAVKEKKKKNDILFKME